jgi:hypothetical protein
MSAEHKAALAQGRAEGAAVKHYLEALESNKPKRGRQRTPDSIKKRLDTIEAAIPFAGSLQYLQLLQEQSDLEAELKKGVETVDLAGVEKEFIKVAKSYGARKGISYSTWRAAGVKADVLAKAGVARARG